MYELYNSIDKSNVATPFDITNGKFTNLKYQIDAIKYGVDCINKNNGVIIADVVGLGKSVIASAIAYNLNIRKLLLLLLLILSISGMIISKILDFGELKCAVAEKLKNYIKLMQNDPNPILYIIDEAHRYRNELSDAYQWLHQLTRSNSKNKVILLTATPYNNRPQDLFALIKLFQTPSRSTINSVDNLSVRFRELIARYNRLEKEGKKNLTEAIKHELNQLSQQLRMLIDPVIVRRSRIDLKEIQEYEEDLKCKESSSQR